jgi:hypothetical protein
LVHAGLGGSVLSRAWDEPAAPKAKKKSSRVAHAFTAHTNAVAAAPCISLDYGGTLLGVGDSTGACRVCSLSARMRPLNRAPLVWLDITTPPAPAPAAAAADGAPAAAPSLGECYCVRLASLTDWSGGRLCAARHALVVSGYGNGSVAVTLLPAAALRRLRVPPGGSDAHSQPFANAELLAAALSGRGGDDEGGGGTKRGAAAAGAGAPAAKRTRGAASAPGAAAAAAGDGGGGGGAAAGSGDAAAAGGGGAAAAAPASGARQGKAAAPARKRRRAVSSSDDEDEEREESESLEEESEEDFSGDSEPEGGI